MCNTHGVFSTWCSHAHVCYFLRLRTPCDSMRTTTGVLKNLRRSLGVVQYVAKCKAIRVNVNHSKMTVTGQCVIHRL